jgi:hypothetical protein
VKSSRYSASVEGKAVLNDLEIRWEPFINQFGAMELFLKESSIIGYE